MFQNWVVFRQGVECGFQGRTNKLVDGCYSFWQVNDNSELTILNQSTFDFYIWLFSNLFHTVCDQGGTAAIIQRLHLIVNKQLGLPYVFKHGSSTDTDKCSTDSDFADRDQVSEGASSPVNDVCGLEQEGMQILAEYILYFVYVCFLVCLVLSQ